MRVCVCVRACVCVYVRACVYALTKVSTDMILHFINKYFTYYIIIVISNVCSATTDSHLVRDAQSTRDRRQQRRLQLQQQQRELHDG